MLATAIPILGPICEPIFAPVLGARFRGNSIDALTAWLEGATYADWDPSQLDRMFTTSTGPTNVASNGDAVGLLIGGSQLGGLTVPAYLAAAAEKAVNGDFSSALSGWTNANGQTVAIVSGQLEVRPNGSVAGFSYSPAWSVSNGAWVEFEFDLVQNISGNVHYIRLFHGTGGGDVVGGLNGTVSPAPGRYKYFMKVPAGKTSVYLRLDVSNSNTSSANAVIIDNVSVKEIPGFHSLQSTSGDRPQYQSGYLRGDGSSDNLLTTWLCGGGGNTLILRRTGPTAGATRIAAGASGSGTARFFIGQNAGGVICGGYGSDGTTTIVGTTSLASADSVIALTSDGSTVKLFSRVAGVVTEEYSGAVNGSPTTTIPFRLCAFNSNGTAGSFDSGDIGRTIAAQKAMSLAEFTAIAPLLAA